MDWLGFVEKISGSSFLQQLTLVGLIIGSMRAHVKKIEGSVEGIRSELRDLKGVFREQNKRIGNVEGTVEAIKYEMFELQQDFKQLKKEN